MKSSDLRKKLPLPLLAGIAALPPLAVDMYLPAIPQIAEDIGTSISTIQNSLSIFLLGFGLGMIFFGPMSDRFGRRPLVMIGLAGFALASLCLTLSTDSTVFLCCRFLQGMLGSAASVSVPAMVRDCYGKDTAKGMSAVTMIMLIAPLIAPLMGSLMLSLLPWEGIFAFETIYPLILLLITALHLPETKQTPAQGPSKGFIGNYAKILGNRRIHLDLLCFMLSALAFFTYLTAVSFVYITYYGVSESLFGILFACSAAALILANFINVRINSRYGPRKLMQTGLALGMCVAFLLVLVTLAHMSLYWTVACFVLMVGCLGISAVNADALVLIEFPDQASTASAVTGTLRFGFGAIAGPLLAWSATGTPLPVALLLFGSLTIACLCQILRHFQRFD